MITKPTFAAIALCAGWMWASSDVARGRILCEGAYTWDYAHPNAFKPKNKAELNLFYGRLVSLENVNYGDEKLHQALIVVLEDYRDPKGRPLMEVLADMGECSPPLRIGEKAVFSCRLIENVPHLRAFELAM